MHYVILDLEWNSAYSKTTHTFVNEIIEFGAVKVDEHFNEVGEFSRLIAPRVKKKLNGRVKELTHLTNEDVAEGGSFLSVASDFGSFVDGAVLMTWGTSVIHALMETYAFYTGSRRIPFLTAYCDLQEYCERAVDRFDEGNQIGLGRFAELIGVEFSEDEQHRATADAVLSLKILKKVIGGYPLDKCILKADCEAFYDRMLFKNHFITDLSSPDIDREQMKFKCENCGKQAKRVKRWKLRNKSFCSDFYCKSCDERFTGRVSFKKRYDGVKVNKRVITPQPQEAKKE